MCKDPNCIFCIECPHCGHMADEHMAGDFDAGICFMCQKENKECHDSMRSMVANKQMASTVQGRK